MASVFLTAEWRKLALFNYAVDPAVLAPYVPFHTELDLWNNTCYVSLVGFMFVNTRLKGIPIPFHTQFEEVNLRFYVRHRHEGEWRRGVVFIREIVPRPALTWVANLVYREPYVTMPMRHVWKQDGDSLFCAYRWKKGNWQSMAVEATHSLHDIAAGSEEEFITEHYWGYTKTGDQKTSEYPVEHPRWQVYPVRDYSMDVDFGRVYSAPFAFLSAEKPVSVFLAEGSPIVVKSGRRI